MTAEPAFIFGVDLDGVCADYTASFREVAAADLGVAPETLGPQLTWDFAEWGLDRQRFDRLHRSAVLEQRILRSMPVIEGAAEALWRLSDAGVWIRVITHRLYMNWGHAIAVADTVEWLDRNSIPYRDLCFLGSKPQVEADAYIDDAPHNIASLREAGNMAIVFDQPYNRHVGGLRAVDWDEVEQLVNGLVAAAGIPLQTQFPGLDEPALRLHPRLGLDSPFGSPTG
jgi:5'(3')-deoxyribonucleotidase